ncbi:MAG: hypothetical protein ACQETI_06525, partial [Halobacteriota archaeon]
MRGDALLTTAVALCCVLAIGTASTTLDSTVTTDPSEVIDVQYDALPVGSEQAKALRDEVSEGDESTDNGRDGADDGTNGAADSRTEEHSSSGQPQSGGGSQRPPDSAGGTQTNDGSSDSASNAGLELLQSLLAALLDLIPYLVILAGVVTAVRFRDRLRRLLQRPGATDSPQRASSFPPAV